MIYECFYFWDELDLLDAKLHEHTAVDKFVLLEFPTSLRHIPQPLNYELNKDRFKEFQDKIIHIVGIDDNKEHTGLSLLFKRHPQYLRGLTECKPDDIIILSSPDVVWKKSTLEQLKTIDMEGKSVQFVADWYSYYMDFFCTEIKYDFDGACLYKDLKYITDKSTPIGQRIESAGWHFSHLGGVDRVLANLHGHPHTEMDNAITRNRDTMIMKMEKGYAWGASGGYRKVMQYVPYQPENYPQYINEHSEIYGQYFRNRE